MFELWLSLSLLLLYSFFNISPFITPFQPSQIKSICRLDTRDRLVQLEDDAQVEDLEEDASIVVMLQ